MCRSDSTLLSQRMMRMEPPLSSPLRPCVSA
jgi:hypothetical protein